MHKKKHMSIWNPEIFQLPSVLPLFSVVLPCKPVNIGSAVCLHSLQKMKIFTSVIPLNSEYLSCYTNFKILLLIEAEFFGLFQYILS